MALQLPLGDDSGNSYPSAYRRVAFFVIDDAASVIVIQTADWKDAAAAARDNAARAPALKPFRTNPARHITLASTPSYADYVAADEANPAGTKATIYGFLKRLPENAGAIDV